MNVQIDTLHVIFITGFVSTIASLTTYIITKSRLAGKYITSEDFTKQIKIFLRDVLDSDKYVNEEDFERRIKAVIKEMVDHCLVVRAKCPLERVEEDIKEIKKVQHARTESLKKRSVAEYNLWRIVLSKFEIPVEQQNRLLEGLSA